MRPDIRHALADYFNDQATWRDVKASEYPDDRRNALSADRLRELSEYVLQLSPDDERLVMAAGLDWTYGGFFRPGEEGSRVASRLGFDNRGLTTLDALFSDFIEACVQDAHAHDSGEQAPWDAE